MLDRPSSKATKVLKEFILLYKKNPCLWQIKSKDYQNRHLKEEAYKQLIDKLRELDPEADRNGVRKKIQSLRTSFQREHKRRETKDSEVPTDQAQPLWYYDLLTFIVDQTNSDEDDEDLDDECEEEDEIDISMIEDEPAIKIESELVRSDEVKTEKDPIGTDGNETIEPVSITRHVAPPVSDCSEYNTKLIKEKMVNGKLMKVIPSTLFKRNCDDKFDYFGKHIAFSLREMDESQSVIAQKLISEIIYRGQMKQLDLTSVQNLSDIMGTGR